MTPPSPGSLFPRRLASVIGWGVLVLWLVWWLACLARGTFLGGEATWIPTQSPLGVDFHGPAQATRHWLQGGNPYNEPFGDPLNRPHIYPPAAFVLYAWVSLVPRELAFPLWSLLFLLLATILVIVCLRQRQWLGLDEWPTSAGLAMVALSTPFLFAMERGNCDLVVVGLVLTAVSALRRRTLASDGLAGMALAFACWIKIYPVVLLPVLLVWGRWRALLGTILASVVMGLADLPMVLDWFQRVQAYTQDFDLAFVPTAHSLSTYWRRLLIGGPLDGLGRVPGQLAAGAILVPAALLGSYRIARWDRNGRLMAPCFLWCLALATFLPPVSNDYNLIVLPLLAMAVWDRRDRAWVHCLLLPLLLWGQPFHLPFLPAKLIFGIKLAGLAALGLALRARAQEEAGRHDATSHSQEASL